MNEVKKNVKTISKAAEFSDIISFYPNLVAILHIWNTYIHFGNNLEFFPMERTEDDNFKKCWFLAASVYNYNSWGGLLYEVLTQIRKCDLCEKGETKYVCMLVEVEHIIVVVYLKEKKWFERNFVKKTCEHFRMKIMRTTAPASKSKLVMKLDIIEHKTQHSKLSL